VSLPDEANPARLDKWLWGVRLYKTRALATAACRAGQVEIGDIVAKPARTVRVGEIITVRQGVILRTVRVEAVPPSRMGAARATEFCTDLTPPEEFQKAREMRVQQVLARDPGAGRPTKRDRRLRDKLFD
jgi:ribosome-associated heat shock protein Hsp15